MRGADIAAMPTLGLIRTMEWSERGKEGSVDEMKGDNLHLLSQIENNGFFTWNNFSSKLDSDFREIQA